MKFSVLYKEELLFLSVSDRVLSVYQLINFVCVRGRCGQGDVDERRLCGCRGHSLRRRGWYYQSYNK